MEEHNYNNVRENLKLIVWQIQNHLDTIGLL